jgi:hypothetical protein
MLTDVKNNVENLFYIFMFFNIFSRKCINIVGSVPHIDIFIKLSYGINIISVCLCRDLIKKLRIFSKITTLIGSWGSAVSIASRLQAG